jgi:hypothetical protein
MQQGLGQLRASVSEADLEHLFAEVDLDRDGSISFDEFAEFLHEYFTDMLIDPVNHDRQPVFHEESYRTSLLRIGKLVFPQLRNLIIQHDLTKTLDMNANEILNFLQRNFRGICVEEVGRLLPNDTSHVGYLEVLKIVMEGVFARSSVNPNPEQMAMTLTNEQFV